MYDAYSLSPAADQALQQVWDVYRQILLKRGVDVGECLDRWVQARKLKFENPQTIIDFDELCADGCHPPILVLLVYLIRNAPLVVTLWAIYLGESEDRKSASKTLEAAALTLEEVFEKLIALADEDIRRQMQEADRIPLSVLISELRLYSNLLVLSDMLKVEAETRSPAELARYLLTYYVERATGRPHDRHVATLLSEAQNREYYDEAAQRMWRDRNYERLSKHHQKLGELVFGIGVVVTRRT